MELKIVTDCSGIDWSIIAESLRKVGMAYHSPEVHKRAFEASYTTVFIYDGSQLTGFGRAISDGEYQGAIYDVAVLPEAQGKGIGKVIIQTILAQLPNCNIILYATPGMEGFYKKFGFGVMTTGMAVFTNPEAMRKFTV
ncbi:GNAT family N-acetyltransferase [Desulforhopalus sp. IMCC35007]|uniref:GNAT family N-acetyltransferase n=1 Tax=Desulforhopalus sp. IMCC35007 TaxID=2569543 RepID=UPI0010AE5664|nr:GNAT family N-acetyltransferase [Desulforhopalus sp. IMCC35007]TKB08151.1 GNAT family N-acetyltransferase [Desulforhopalus sp. IMCC35007]